MHGGRGGCSRAQGERVGGGIIADGLGWREGAGGERGGVGRYYAGGVTVEGGTGQMFFVAVTRRRIR